MDERKLHIKERHPDATFAEIGKSDTVWAVKQIDTQHARVVLKISTI